MSLIEYIRADRAKGTPGDWAVADETLIAVDNGQIEGVYPDYYRYGAIVADVRVGIKLPHEANARRIARVPQYEAALEAAERLARELGGLLSAFNDGMREVAGNSNVNAAQEALAAYREAVK